MKKIALVVLALLLVSAPVYAFNMRNEPLGWQGWQWEITANRVKGWLNYNGQLTLPIIGATDDVIYTRQGQANEYFSQEWLDSLYVFEKGRLCAVVLLTDDCTAVGRAISYFGKDVATNDAKQPMSFYGKGGGEIASRVSEESRSTIYYYSAAKGTYASFLYISGPTMFLKPEEVLTSKHCVIIGEKSYMNRLIDKVAEGL